MLLFRKVVGPKGYGSVKKAAALETDDWSVYWDKGSRRWYYVHKYTGRITKQIN